MKTMILKNGATIGFKPHVFMHWSPPSKVIMDIYIDPNGKEGPNTVGRDFLIFYITENGKIIGGNDVNPDYEELVTKCKTVSVHACTSAIIQDNWNIKF